MADSDSRCAVNRSEKRVEIIWGVLEKKRAPFVDPYKLDSAAVQFIEDMENKAEIVDRSALLSPSLSPSPYHVCEKEGWGEERDVARSRGARPKRLDVVQVHH